MIRFANDTHKEDIIRMSEEFCAYAGYPFKSSSLSSFIDKNIAETLVYLGDDNEVKGFFSYVVFPFWSTESFFISQELAIWVKPENRKNGIAKALIEEYVKIMKERKIDKICVTRLKGKEDEKLSYLYDSLGFKEEEIAYSLKGNL